MAHDDEFAKIMKFFSMSQEERAENFENVFEQSAEFFEKFNHIMKEGTLEEKQLMISELQELQKVVQEETDKLSDSSGLSPEELKEFASKPENFSPEQWEMIQSTRSRIEKDAEEASNNLSFNELPNSPAKPIKKKKTPRDKGGWIKS